jgi:hypothetical protein
MALTIARAGSRACNGIPAPVIRKDPEASVSKGQRGGHSMKKLDTASASSPLAGNQKHMS